MLDIIMDTLLDSVKLLPFLFLTYLVMELLEHKAGGKLLKKISQRKNILRNLELIES